MKKIFRFSKYFLPAAVLSTVIIIAGIAGYLAFGGFNLGVDFQAGLLQEVQFAPAAFSLGYSGEGNASLSYSRTGLSIVVSGAGVDEKTYEFPFSRYTDLNGLLTGLKTVPGLNVTAIASDTGSIQSSYLVQSAQGDPQLGAAPLVLHYLAPGAAVIPIENVRAALLPLGQVSVQVLGVPEDRHFMIRMQESEVNGEQGVPADKIIDALEKSFGEGGVAVTKSDYVGSRFSQQLTSQAGLLLFLTLLLILAYSSVRFKPQYAVGAVLAILHDALIMVAFITWTRMEFNTTTIAAILTILGYSINDTIVIFDRVRETRRMYPDDSFIDVLNRAITETLSRTIITTVTTMLAVISLFIFTTGSMKDFALALLVGMTSGVYSTIFIACGFVNFWNNGALKREEKRRHQAALPAKA